MDQNRKRPFTRSDRAQTEKAKKLQKQKTRLEKSWQNPNYVRGSASYIQVNPDLTSKIKIEEKPLVDSDTGYVFQSSTTATVTDCSVNTVPQEVSIDKEVKTECCIVVKNEIDIPDDSISSDINFEQTGVESASPGNAIASSSKVPKFMMKNATEITELPYETQTGDWIDLGTLQKCMPVDNKPESCGFPTQVKVKSLEHDIAKQNLLENSIASRPLLDSKSKANATTGPKEVAQIIKDKEVRYTNQHKQGQPKSKTETSTLETPTTGEIIKEINTVNINHRTPEMQLLQDKLNWIKGFNKKQLQIMLHTDNVTLIDDQYYKIEYKDVVLLNTEVLQKLTANRNPPTYSSITFLDSFGYPGGFNKDLRKDNRKDFTKFLEKYGHQVIHFRAELTGLTEYNPTWYSQLICWISRMPNLKMLVLLDRPHGDEEEHTLFRECDPTYRDWDASKLETSEVNFLNLPISEKVKNLKIESARLTFPIIKSLNVVHLTRFRFGKVGVQEFKKVILKSNPNVTILH